MERFLDIFSITVGTATIIAIIAIITVGLAAR